MTLIRFHFGSGLTTLGAIIRLQPSLMVAPNIQALLKWPHFGGMRIGIGEDVKVAAMVIDRGYEAMGYRTPLKIVKALKPSVNGDTLS